MKDFKLTPETAKAVIYLAVGVMAIIIISKFSKQLFAGLNKFLESFGFKDDPETKKAKDAIAIAEEEAVKNPESSAWSPAMYKLAPNGARLVKVAVADKAAKQIYNSSGRFLPDKPEEALAAIKLMPSQAAVSFLTERFELLFQADLLSWLTEAFNDTDIQIKTHSQIITFVANLKKY